MGHKKRFKKDVVLIVAHPDDEILWAGGTIISNPNWNWFVVTLCRASDTDRASKFFSVLTDLGIKGDMGDLDDGQEQNPLAQSQVQDALLALVPDKKYDLIITHGQKGEYERHIRHEEVSEAVLSLWASGKIAAKSLWMFAYEDGGGKYLPRAIEKADLTVPLFGKVWENKYRLIRENYGFKKSSFEARTTPRVEAFWCFDSKEAGIDFLNRNE